MATKEDMVRVANSFLLNSPPGEFMEVVTEDKDVRTLLYDDSLLNDTALNTFKQWNTDQMLQVKSPNGGHEVLITKYGEVNDAEYLDPLGNCIIQFDHIKQVSVGCRPIDGEMDAEVEGYRAAFEGAAFEYVSDYYLGGTTVYGGKRGANYVITICISSSKFNAPNYWNGRWKSVWTCTFTPNGKITLDGVIKLHIHYYEDGNVQLRSETKKSSSCPGGDPTTAADNAIKAIAKIEGDFQAALDLSYATMGDTTFKALRRMLPIHRSKMDWDWLKIQALKVGTDAVNQQ